MTRHIALVAILLLMSCSTNTDRMDSLELSEKEERITTLRPEIKAYSDFSDAEFELFNVNGFSNSRSSITVPGSSSWYYKFAIKINPSDIAKWTTGMRQVDSVSDIQWTKQIIVKRKENWKVESPPKYFVREGDDVEMIVYEKEGFIFKKIINN
ncbi:MAG: hypothetical protein ABUL44_03645 [Flavobacterium sp.]